MRQRRAQVPDLGISVRLEQISPKSYCWGAEAGLCRAPTGTSMGHLGISEHRALRPKGTGGQRGPGGPSGAPMCPGLSCPHAPRDTQSLPAQKVLTGPCCWGQVPCKQLLGAVAEGRCCVTGEPFVTPPAAPVVSVLQERDRTGILS